MCAYVYDKVSLEVCTKQPGNIDGLWKKELSVSQTEVGEFSPFLWDFSSF